MAAGSVLTRTAVGHPLPEDCGPLVRLPPERLAEVLLGALVAAYGALAILGVVFGSRDLASGLVSGIVILALLALQVGYLSRPDRRPRAPAKYLALALQAGLVLGPIAVFGPEWHGFPGILAGSALLVLPAAVGVPVFALIVVTVVLISSTSVSPQTADLDQVVALTYVTTSTVTAGVALFGLTTLVRLTVEAHRTREDLNRAAVTAERARFAGRLQEAVGEALSSIALRGELIVHLVGEQNDRARAELRALLIRARSALADARTLTRTRERLEASSSEGADPTATGAAGPLTRPARVVAAALLLVVLVDFTVLATVAVAADAGPAVAAVTAAVRLAELALVVVMTQRADRMGPTARTAGLLLLATLVFVPVWWLGPQGHGAEGWLIGTALVVLPLSRALAVAVPAWLGAIAVEYVDPSPSPSLLYSLAYTAIGMLVSATIVWGLGTAVRLLREVEDARERMRVLAVGAERERLARDVHDLLGLGLTVITVKCELASRLLDTDAARARHELTEAMARAHGSLGDLRLVHADTGSMSLTSECRVADSALRAADIGVRLEIEGPVGGDATLGTSAALAAVLREGVTNVLRHSSATWCAITVRVDEHTATLEIVNDGVPATRPPGAGDGTGLRNMTARMRSIGGSLEVCRDEPLHRVRAVAPSHGGPGVGDLGCRVV